MMDHHTKALIGALVPSILSLCGCGQHDAPKQAMSEPAVVEELAISGFDPNGEPVIKKWSDGSIWIQFEAMPPFFAEDEGTEADFEQFETKIQEALGVPVLRDDREVFIIADPQPDTVQKAKAWLEAYRKQKE